MGISLKETNMDDDTYTNYIYQTVSTLDKLGYGRDDEDINRDLNEWGAMGYRVVSVVGKLIIMEVAEVHLVDEDISPKKP